MLSLFGKKQRDRSIRPQRPARWGEIIDVRGDGRIIIWDVSTHDSTITLFDVAMPWRHPTTGGSNVVLMASLVLLRKEGWYTFRKDRSGGLWLDDLATAGLVDRNRIIMNENGQDYGQCCPLSERALRFLTMVV